VLVALEGGNVVGALRLSSRKPWSIDLRLFTPVEQAIYLTEMVIAPHTGVPDELYISITLEGAGGRHERGKFIRAPHERFGRLVEIVRQTAARAVDGATRERLTL
jgi:hypothetical protein